MRVDKAKNIAKVDKILIAKPLLSQREIAEEAEVWLWTVNRIRQELEQNGTKDERILWITDTDLSILTIGQREIERRLKNNKEVEKMRTVEISQVIKESTARYSLFRWSATDSGWGLKETVTIEI